MQTFHNYIILSFHNLIFKFYIYIYQNTYIVLFD